MITIERRTLETPHGPGRLVQRRAPSPFATLIMTHGAGAGIETGDLRRIAISLPSYGVNTAMLELPWVGQGRRIAPSRTVLDESFVAMVNRLRPQTPTFVGGRSTGARLACRHARRLGGVGAVAVSFPLHPKGRPERSRIDELDGARVPVLVVQGERDELGAPEEFPPQLTLARVPYADHSMVVPKRAPVDQDATYRLVATTILQWIAARLKHDLPGTSSDGSLLN
ncbi:alpha/beta hydrolase family protein [Solicola gregarius]|uniref:Hydrolase n=1 Tax=Solicola gregarius TaxID=2908642 RepID=A0AA46TJK4_9ACTN|nr:alpha/beta family hydrolase [Solicola gregarius]UYM06032.1 hydrolase [Solicola gregarius]